MKIRHGFVSNSSSSSFIIGIAKVNDANLLLEKLKSCDSYYSLLTKNDVVEGLHGYATVEDNKVVLESFSGARVELALDDTPLWLLVRFYGDEGDNTFLDEYSDEIDYDIDESFFDESGQAMMDILKSPDKNGLGEAQYQYGAARNG